MFVFCFYLSVEDVGQRDVPAEGQRRAVVLAVVAHLEEGKTVVDVHFFFSVINQTRRRHSNVKKAKNKQTNKQNKRNRRATITFFVFFIVYEILD